MSQCSGGARRAVPSLQTTQVACRIQWAQYHPRIIPPEMPSFSVERASRYPRCDLQKTFASFLQAPLECILAGFRTSGRLRRSVAGGHGAKPDSGA